MGTGNIKAGIALTLVLFVAQVSVCRANTILDNTVMIPGVMTWTQDLSNVTRPSARFTVTENPDGTTTFMGEDSISMMTGGGSVPLWDYNWNITADPDPFIAGSFSVTNTSAVSQIFDITFSLPISPSFTNGFMTGSLEGSYLDADSSGSAALSLNDWDGLIDGATQMNLFAFGGSCTGMGCSVSIGPVSEGPTLYVGNVSSTIGIHMNFELSAGDTASFDTSFEVNPVPVPAAVWLFATGLAGLIGVARRRQTA